MCSNVLTFTWLNEWAYPHLFICVLEYIYIHVYDHVYSHVYGYVYERVYEHVYECVYCWSFWVFDVLRPNGVALSRLEMSWPGHGYQAGRRKMVNVTT